MRRQKNRIERLERRAPPFTPEFICITDNQWTPEQKAEAMRRRPTQRLFWRSLLETPEETQRKMEDPTAEL